MENDSDFQCFPCSCWTPPFYAHNDVEIPYSFATKSWFLEGVKKIGRGFLVSGFLRRSTVPPLCAPSAASFLGSAPCFFLPRRFLCGARRPHEIRWSPARNQGGCRGFTMIYMVSTGAGAGEDLRYKSDRAGYAKRFNEIGSGRFAFLLGRLRRWFHGAQPQIWWLQLLGERFFVDPCDSDIPILYYCIHKFP